MAYSKKQIAVVLAIILMLPVVFGLSQVPTFNFFDETPGNADAPGSFSLIPAQFDREFNVAQVILRMGGNVRDYDGRNPRSEKWKWQPGAITDPNNPSPIAALDYDGDGRMNDVAFITGSGEKNVIVRKGQKDDVDLLWQRSFNERVYSIASTDYDGDGNTDELIVASGQHIYVIEPSTNTNITDFSVNVEPRIIAPADLDKDGKKNEVVVGTWIKSVSGEDNVLSNGQIIAYFSDGGRSWSFPQPSLDRKVSSIVAFDKNSDGSEEELLVIFTDDTDASNPTSDLYLVSSGTQLDFWSDVRWVTPADFDQDGILDDFILLYKDRIFSYTSDLNYIVESTLSPSDLNTTDEKDTINEFLAVTSLSFQRDSQIGNIFNDAAIFVRISQLERAIIFADNIAFEEKATTTTTTVVTTTTTTTTLPPQPPVARITGISDGTTIQAGASILLSASASSDADGDIVLYEWLVDDVLRASGPQSRDFTFNTQSLASGAHVVTLRVTDNDGMVSVKTITINLSKGNVPPIADGGPDRSVQEGDAITLSASGSSDPDGEIETYEWSEDGTVFSLDKDVVKTFTVGLHTVTLKVTDTMGAASFDTVEIRVNKRNSPPKAQAGEDITVLQGEPVQFSAMGSTDTDGNITTYSWILPDGQVIRQPEFNATFPVGAYRVRLNVTDDKGAVGTDEILVTVDKRPNRVQGFYRENETEIKTTALTLVALASSILVFLRSRRPGPY